MKLLNYKTLTLITISSLMLVVFSLFINLKIANAIDPGCYVVSQGSRTESTCPDVDSEGNDIDSSKCYFAPGGSQGVGSFSETSCDIEGSSETSARPGSSSGNCSSLTEEQEAALTPDDICYKVNLAENADTDYQCGKGPGSTVATSINIGCRGEDYPRESLNPIIDMAFALFRFLSAGVGLVVIGSIVVAGIQYTISRGNPQATEASIKRITSSVTALILYVFIYAIANFLIPGGMFF